MPPAEPFAITQHAKEDERRMLAALSGDPRLKILADQPGA